jgi:hypothetical protein
MVSAAVIWDGGTCDLYALGLLDEHAYLPLVVRGP